jgi:hypothetical protein
MTALFTVRLPANAQTVPFHDVPLLMAEARHGPRESLDEPALSLFGTDWLRDESELEKAFNRGEVVVLDSSAYPMRPPIAANRLAKGVMTVDALCQYLEGVNMALEQFDNKPQAAQTLPADTEPAPVVETKEQRQDNRLKACEAAGLVMPANSMGRLPDGVGDVADKHRVTRQTFSTDVKAALKRREAITKPGRIVRRT